MRKKSILVAVLVASLVLLTGPAAAQGFSDQVSVNAGAQATTGDNVTIDSVEMNQSGWVAVYEEDSVGGGPDMNSLVGSAEVSEGTNTNIEVDTDIQESGFYYAVLHTDGSAPAEFDPQTDPAVEVNGTQVQDFFFVAVGTRDIYAQYANAKQNRRALQNRLDRLRQRVDELERRNQRTNNASIQSDIDGLKSEIQMTQQRLQNLSDTIAETERLLQQLEEQQQTEDSTGGSQTGGNGTAGNETGTNETEGEGTGTDSGSGGGSEGLPGFTAVAALVAALTVALLSKRNG